MARRTKLEKFRDKVIICASIVTALTGMVGGLKSTVEMFAPEKERPSDSIRIEQTIEGMRPGDRIDKTFTRGDDPDEQPVSARDPIEIPDEVITGTAMPEIASSEASEYWGLLWFGLVLIGGGIWFFFVKNRHSPEKQSDDKANT